MVMFIGFESFLVALPKIDLSLHFEGMSMSFCNWPENRVLTKLGSVTDDFYRRSLTGLKCSDDFKLTVMKCLMQAQELNVKHVELCFSPQVHLERGLSFLDVIKGIYEGVEYGRTQCDLSVKLIMCLSTNQQEKYAVQALRMALDSRDIIAGIGLHTYQDPYPVAEFTRVCGEAKGYGYHLFIDAGVNALPTDYWQALQLNAQRVAFSISLLDDQLLCERLRNQRVPIMLSPCWYSYRSGVELDKIPVKELLFEGFNLCLTADSPGYSCCTILDNMLSAQEAWSLSKQDWKTLTTNAINASLASAQRKKELLSEVYKVA
jgi:adenosine deaminase